MPAPKKTSTKKEETPKAEAMKEVAPKKPSSPKMVEVVLLQHMRLEGTLYTPGKNQMPEHLAKSITAKRDK